MLVEVNVTEDDIVKGIKGNCSQCPVALAVNRILKDRFFSAIGGLRVTISEYGMKDYDIHMSDSHELWSFVRQFDDYGPNYAHPFSFSLDIPEGFLLNV